MPFAIVAVLGLIGGSVLDIYSSGLALLTPGVRIPRYAAALIDGTVMTLGTIYVVFVAHSGRNVAIRQEHGKGSSFAGSTAFTLAEWGRPRPAGIRWSVRPAPWPGAASAGVASGVSGGCCGC